MGTTKADKLSRAQIGRLHSSLAETPFQAVSGVRCANLEVVRDGNARRCEVLLVGAHYDSVMGSPGANDNASGVAALLEISRKFAAIEPAMTVSLLSFWRSGSKVLLLAGQYDKFTHH
jgi:hypothetical protein